MTPKPALTQPLYLVGPTAVGKSTFAIHLARLLTGEVISTDAMQVYRGLDIGTGKLSTAEQAGIPHHLLDVVEIQQPFDVARFVQLASQIQAEIVGRGHTPIFCGGTGLYFNALLHGLGETPPSDRALRAELAAAPLQTLLTELEERDPATFKRIDRSNPRRVIRALEVIRLTGRPFSEQRATWPPGASPELNGLRILGLRREPADLKERIHRRVEAMIARGLVAETANLLAHGLRENQTAMQAIGYRQVGEFLDGRRSLEETVQLIQQRTSQYAKRQMTWFRHQLPAVWLTVPAGVNAETFAPHVALAYRTGSDDAWRALSEARPTAPTLLTK